MESALSGLSAVSPCDGFKNEMVFAMVFAGIAVFAVKLRCTNWIPAVPFLFPEFGEFAQHFMLLRSRAMARKVSLVFLAIASPVMLGLFFMPWPWAEVLFSVLVMGYPVALIVVAVGRRGGVGPLGLPLLALLVFLEACAIGMLLLRGHVTDAPWFGGLPLAAAIQLYGLFLTPLLLVALAYALTFDRFEIREEDLDRLADHTRASKGDAE